MLRLPSPGRAVPCRGEEPAAIPRALRAGPFPAPGGVRGAERGR